MFENSILNHIGDTPLIEISSRIVPDSSARIFAKIEGSNPTGSMKDRMALAMIEEAEKDGRLKKGDTVVEYTSGSTGTSLALVCAIKGYHLKIVTSNAFSQEKLNHMEALGAELVVIKSNDGKITEELFKKLIEKARQLSYEPNVYWTDQINNHDMLVGYRKLGEEIVSQTNKKIDMFVHSVGTCGSLRGISSVLNSCNPSINITAVEPTESAVLSGRKSGAHSIEGMGAGFVVPHWSAGLANDIVTVSTDEAMECSRMLAKKDAIFAGTSSGANLHAALQIASGKSKEHTIVTLFPDNGLKYLSTALYKHGL